MELDQKQENPFKAPENKKSDKKTLAIYVITALISFSSLIFGYASYQATYFKDLEIKNLKMQLDDANTKLVRIDMLENQVKELELSLKKKNGIRSKRLKHDKKTTKKPKDKESVKNSKSKIKTSPN
jgi:hypothetical protein